jgi:hypothetical protein
MVLSTVGASSGIGLATLRRVINHGGKVFASDVNSLPEPEASSVPFLKVDVTSWKEQVAMFKAAEKEYGKIDHVFANAGISQTISLFEDDVDENGDLLPPKLNTLNVNLIGCMYTVKLGINYLKKSSSGGSIVMTASGSSFTRFPPTDYSMYAPSPHNSTFLLIPATQQPRNTPSSAFSALSLLNSTPNSPSASTPLRPPGPRPPLSPNKSSPRSARETTNLLTSLGAL